MKNLSNFFIRFQNSFIRFVVFAIAFFTLTFPTAIFTQTTILPQPCEVNEYGEAVCDTNLQNADESRAVDLDSLALDEKKIPYVLFHLDTCAHCKDEIAFIEKEVKPRYEDSLDIRFVEVGTAEGAALYKAYAQSKGMTAGSVPAAFIGNQVVLGYSNDEVTGARIIDIIDAQIKGGQSNSVRIPFLGKIDAQSFSLPLLAVILGFLDGFNPCAMWVLLFLISLLLGMHDRKRMWWLGSLFIITSGISYFVFMSAWLQLILFIGLIGLIRIIIGLVAIGVGGFSLRDYWQNRNTDGVVCKVSKNTGAKRIFERIKEIVHRKSLWWAVTGIVLLGFSVNLVELACSAGFPALFTQILAINHVPTWQRYAYMSLYILLYMLDDMIIFGLAMKTMKIADANSKYAKYANLIAGILMVLLGMLLIFRPQWLMFT